MQKNLHRFFIAVSLGIEPRSQASEAHVLSVVL